MKILLFLLGSVFVSQRTTHSRILAGSDSKSEFFKLTKNLVFDKIKEYYQFYLANAGDLDLKKLEGATWTKYKTEGDDADDHTVGIFIKNVEVFKLRFKPNLGSPATTETKPEEIKDGDASNPTDERLVKRRNLSEKPELRSFTSPASKERSLLDFNEKDLCLELSNSALKSVFTIQYGFKLSTVITNFILRNLQAFLFRTEQVVVSLKQIEPDISNLFEIVFQNFGNSTPNTKVIDKVQGLQRAPDLSEVDIDMNYLKVIPVFRKEENQLLLTLQKVALEKLTKDAAPAKAYFESKIEDLKKSNGDDKNKSFETLIYVVSPNKPSLDPIELMIVKTNGKVVLVAYSSFFQIEQVYSECTQRYIIKSLEKEFVKIRDNILSRVLALQEFKPKRYQASQLAEEIAFAFGGLFENAENPLSFKSKAGLPNPFALSLTQLKDEIELLFTATSKSTQEGSSGSESTEVQTLVIRKRYPVTSLYYTKGFPESFIKEISKNVLLVVPRFKGAAAGAISFEASNFGYYKNVAMPFVDVTEVMQDLQDNVAIFSKQEGRKKNQILKQFFYRQTREPISTYTVDYAWAESADPKKENVWERIGSNKNLRVLEAIIRKDQSFI